MSVTIVSQQGGKPMPLKAQVKLVNQDGSKLDSAQSNVLFSGNAIETGSLVSQRKPIASNDLNTSASPSSPGSYPNFVQPINE